MDGDALSLLTLQQAPGVGVVTANRLIAISAACGRTLPELIAMPPEKLARIMPPGAAKLAGFLRECTPARVAAAREHLKSAAKIGARAIAVTDPDYPSALKLCLDEQAPPVLFVRGETSLLQSSAAAVVGARQATPAGIHLARKCAKAFAERQISVVSGGAAGVDTAAHEAAIDSGGTTIMVLPMGILQYGPDAKMAAALDAGKACLLSEFAPDAAWMTHAAVTRNATISALARIVCVIEPRKVGGSIRTAILALRHGKPVFCHAGGKGSAVRTWMKSSGIHDLVDGSGEVDLFSLFEAWPVAPPKGRKQMDLI